MQNWTAHYDWTVVDGNAKMIAKTTTHTMADHSDGLELLPSLLLSGEINRRRRTDHKSYAF